MRRRRHLSRAILDSWFPTLARYLGLMLVPYAVLIDRGSNPFLWPLLTGLILFKTVAGGGKD